MARKRPSNRKFGEWLSLVEHLVRDQGVGGSNPLSPTIYKPLESFIYDAFFCAGVTKDNGPFWGRFSVRPIMPAVASSQRRAALLSSFFIA